MRKPKKIELSKSLPAPSVPNQKVTPSKLFVPGGRRESIIVTTAKSYGLVGDIIGAKIAIKMIANKIMSAKTAILLAKKSLQNRQKGLSFIYFFQVRESTTIFTTFTHQSCFEIYVEGSKYGEALWDKLFKVGKDLDVRAGCPNLIERIESGLLSFGNDITPEHTPFEAGLGKFLSSGINPECLAYESLKKNDSPKRIIKPIKIEGSPIEPITYWVEILDEDNEFSGYISSAAWSSEFNTNVAIGMVNRKYWNIGSKLKIILSDESTRNITVEENFWS